MRWALGLILLMVPSLSQAAIIINEVSWMGSAVSANHEWIELKNTDDSSVDVSGWNLSDGMNLSIELTGTIAPSAYAVLERSSDDSANGAAFLIYTGALVNTGATLKLTRADGGLEDQVAGGENWQTIGGDNVTKETAQYTTAGWVTGTPTPNAVNSGVVKPPAETEESSSGNSSGNGNKKGIIRSNPADETVRLVLKGVTLMLAIEGQKVGYVNQPIEFSVTPSGVGKTISDSLLYEWNFGDGATALGKEVSHAFRYPGKYVVTAYGLYKRQEQVTRHEITVLPVTLSLTRSEKGEIQMSNDSPYEIDISNYRVTGSKAFTFPEYSILLPNQTITLSKEQVGSGFVVVRDAASSVVVSELQAAPRTQIQGAYTTTQSLLLPKSQSATQTGVSLPQQYVTAPLILASSSKVKEGEEETFVGTTLKNDTVPSDALPYIGLLGTVLIGLVGTGIRAKRNQNG